MPWRAKCYECEQEAGITRPHFETKDSYPVWTLLDQNLENAVAYYENHPRSAADARPCGGVGKHLPKFHMRLAHSTTPDEDPPTWGRRPTSN
jgi:hypothetical protein